MDIEKKLRKIEALIASTQEGGEKKAAQMAKRRLEAKIISEPAEFRISLGSVWEKSLFMAVCAKYGITTYRYARQKRTTAMVRINKEFMNSVLFPEYKKYAKLLGELTDGILQDLIAKVHPTKPQETVISEKLPLSMST